MYTAMAASERGLAQFLSEITPRTKEIYTRPELEERLTLGRALRIKIGFDATKPDLHVGHLAPLLIARRFQELGHKIILLVGQFTACVGDPSGRSSTRPLLVPEEAATNAEQIRRQLESYLDPDLTEIVNNVDWLRNVCLEDWFRLAASISVGRLLAKETFRRRLQQRSCLSLAEFCYPILHGLDSVLLRADVEVGGADQIFNLLLGRELQRHANQLPQVAVTIPLLPGTDGSDKMSKSTGNFIALREPAEDIYGKVMSIPDDQMRAFFWALSELPASQIERIVADLGAGRVHPMDAKKLLARQVVQWVCGDSTAASSAEEHFETVVQQRGTPSDVPRFFLDTQKKAGRTPCIRGIGQISI
jgi:tyrosyl-tRNA synthetase